jgi:hypothetical protein
MPAAVTTAAETAVAKNGEWQIHFAFVCAACHSPVQQSNSASSCLISDINSLSIERSFDALMRLSEGDFETSPGTKRGLRRSDDHCTNTPLDNILWQQKNDGVSFKYLWH